MPQPEIQATLQPAQAQRWNMLGGFQGVVASPAAQKELWGWCVLALLSLGLAGIFALLLAVSRVPHVQDVFPWPLQFFEKGLVIHVVFSFVVWFLSILGALGTIATYRVSAGEPKLAGLGPLAVWGSLIAFLLLFVPGFLDRGEPSLNNYVPVIIDPLYYAGLVVFFLSLVVIAIRLAVNVAARTGAFEPVSQTTLLSGGVFLLSLICFAIAYGDVAGGEVNGAYNEELFWGGGHVMQFLNTGLMMAAWYVIGGNAIGRPLVDPRLFRAAIGLLYIATPGLVAIYFVAEPMGFDVRESFTWMQYWMGPPVLIMAGAMIVTLSQHRDTAGSLPWRDPGFVALILSALVFFFGGFLGIFVDGADTRTPAHYHGVIGGVNTAFMGLFFVFFLPLLDRGLHTGRAILLSIWFYAVGQTFHSLGLFMAGGYGAPRKTAGADQGIEELGAEIGLYLMGVGAVVAVAGGVMFIWIVARALARRRAAA